MTTAGERILKSGKQALAFAEGKKNHGCKVHLPEEINVRRNRRNRERRRQPFGRV